MSLYLGEYLASLHQQELLDEAAIERLGRLAREGQPEQHRRLPAGRLVAAVTTMALVLLAIVAGFDMDDLVVVAGRTGGFG